MKMVMYDIDWWASGFKFLKITDFFFELKGDFKENGSVFSLHNSFLTFCFIQMVLNNC